MHQLCFEVSQNALRFAIIDSGSSEIVREGLLPLKSRTAELKKEDCSNFLRAENLLDFDSEISLSYSGPRATLAPQQIFGESSAKDIFELCFGTSNNLIEHNRFYEQTLVVVYEIEDWIKRFFVVRYPRIVVQHETTHLLRGIFSKDSFPPALHIVLNPNFFSVYLVAKNKLQFFNTFDFSAVEDVYYYSMHIWNNGDFKDKTMQIIWHADPGMETLYAEFSNLVQLNHQNSYSLATQSKIKHQLLCV